jgi:DNA-binding transcriptional ArsR family regulator
MRSPVTEEWFSTTGEQLLKDFWIRLHQYKKGLQFRGGMNVKLNETESLVYKFIQKGTKDTNGLMGRTGKTRRTVLQAIHKLEDAGLVEKVGTARFVTYKLKEGAPCYTESHTAI